MSEYAPEDAAVEVADGVGVAEEIVAGAQEFEPVRTGVDLVDEVLVSVEGLEGRPVDEHVAVFERAHEDLCRALDGRTDA